MSNTTSASLFRIKDIVIPPGNAISLIRNAYLPPNTMIVSPDIYESLKGLSENNANEEKRYETKKKGVEA